VVDHLAVAEVHTVKLTDGDPSRPRHGVLKPGHLHVLTCIGEEA
jgi:hypothetical protein